MQVGRLGIGSALAGGVLGVAAMVGVGVGVREYAANAQTPSPTATATATATAKQAHVEDYLVKLAANLGVTVDELQAANVATLNQLIDEAQAAGRITAEQATQAKERVAQGGGAHFGPHFGGGHHRGTKGFMPDGAMMRGAGQMLDNVAAFLGVDRATLMQELMSGKSLAQVAADHGKSRDELKAVLSAEFGTMLDALIDRSFTMPHGSMDRGSMTPMLAPGT